MAEVTNAISKIFLGLFIFELLGVLLGVAIGSTVTIPALTQLNTSVSGISTTISNVANVTSYHIITPSTSQCSTFDIFCGFSNYIIVPFINFIGIIIAFIVEVTWLFVQMVIVLSFILIILIPSLFSSSALGVFGWFFGFGYILLALILGIYCVELLLSLVKGFL